LPNSNRSGRTPTFLNFNGFLKCGSKLVLLEERDCHRVCCWKSNCIGKVILLEEQDFHKVCWGRVIVLERWYCCKSGTVIGLAVGRIIVLERCLCWKSVGCPEVERLMIRLWEGRGVDC
jgi:hypothetical protein